MGAFADPFACPPLLLIERDTHPSSASPSSASTTVRIWSRSAYPDGEHHRFGPTCSERVSGSFWTCTPALDGLLRTVAQGTHGTGCRASTRAPECCDSVPAFFARAGQHFALAAASSATSAPQGVDRGKPAEPPLGRHVPQFPNVADRSTGFPGRANTTQNLGTKHWFSHRARRFSVCTPG
jgi:hypothetical protein